MKYLKNKYTILSLIVLLIVIITLIVINKDTIVSKYFGNNSALVVYTTNPQFINSGSGLASGSGSMSGSGTGSSVLTEVYYPDLNLYEIEVSNTQQLNQLYSRTHFINPEDRNRFYTLSSQALTRGGKLGFYFDPQNIAGESVGYYNGKYLNNEFVDKGVNCATKATVRKKPSTPAAAVSRIAKWYGICGILSVAHSLVYSLGAPLPPGFPKATSTKSNKEIWNRPFLDKITEKVPKGNPDDGTTSEDEQKIYEQYFPVSTVHFSRISGGWLGEWNKLFKFWNETIKKDCKLLNNGGEHISHIKNIYTKDGKKYIEITNTLNQGSDDHSDVPINPGVTTLSIDEDGCMTVDHHDANVSKTSKAYWAQKDYQSRLFKYCNRASVDCVTPKVK